MGETLEYGDRLTFAELESENALELPARNLMSLVNINIGVINAINLSGAMNVLTQGSTAASGALQQISFSQFL